MTEDAQLSNRDRKVAGRAKRRRYGQGTRAYLHAMTNSVARRAKGAQKIVEIRDEK